ncbi:MAG: outer membrane beta-barrel protein [Gammaproteobacteria bacterium]|nr:outer membrane beta-barrel protein [Gammaproteobacteria bacterium]
MKRSTLAVAMLSVLAGTPAVAEVKVQENGLPVGDGWYSFFKLGLNNTYNDNIFSANTNEKDAWITSLLPTARLEARPGLDRYYLEYAGDIGWYENSSTDDYDDHRLTASGHREINSRNRLDLTAEAIKEHDERGSGRTEGGAVTADPPDEYHSLAVRGVYGYGAMSAKGRFDFEAGHLAKEYDNNRAATTVRDRGNTDLGVTFFYRVQPKTSLLLQAKDTRIDYDTANTLDSDEYRLLAGVTWDATAKTTGLAKFGYLNKDFDSAARSDFEGFSWEVGARWMPRTYSYVDLNTSRKTEETDGTGDYVLTQAYNLSWTHDWSHRFSTSLSGGYSDKDYGANTRRDDEYSAGLAGTYLIQKWLSVKAGYDYSERDSNVNTNDYDRNRYFVNLTAAY